MTKQETIKQHYITEFINSGMGKEEAEETFNRKLYGYIDKNGWCRAYFNYFDVIKHDKRKNSWRPKSLCGLENNRGWTSILSEKDLPSDIGFYWIKDKSGSIEICRYYGKEDVSFRVWITQFTHYQPITKPLQPLH